MFSLAVNDYREPKQQKIDISDYLNFIQLYRQLTNINVGGQKALRQKYCKSCELVMSCTPNDGYRCFPMRLPLNSFQGGTPIISYGCILRYTDGIQVEYLLLRRSDSVEYTDFIRGNYRPSHLYMMLRGCIPEERNDLRELSFPELWTKHCGKPAEGKAYEYAYSRFEEVKNILPQLLDAVSCNDIDGKNLWLFPKGRLNYHQKNNECIVAESPLECAFREFVEETMGYTLSEESVMFNHPVAEYYIGSNSKSYGTRYFVFHTDTKLPLHPFTDARTKLEFVSLENIQQKLNPDRVKLIQFIEDQINQPKFNFPGEIHPLWKVPSDINLETQDIDV